MLYYERFLKSNARNLRNNLTDTEQLLWFHLRRKRIHNIQFYRQKPIGQFIVDFYAPRVKLVIEIDGGQHFEKAGIVKDKKRDAYLLAKGLQLLRFDNLQVLKTIDDVLEVIFRVLEQTLKDQEKNK